MLAKWIDRLPLGWSVKFTLLRLLARWRSMLMVILGVLLAAVIGANVSLYTTAVSQVGMVKRLDAYPPAARHIHTFASFQDDSDFIETRSQLNQNIQAIFERELSSFSPNWIEQIVGGIESTSLTVKHDGLSVDPYRLRLASYDGWQEHAQLIEGELPQVGQEPIEAALPVEVAHLMALQVGDVIELSSADAIIPIRITGLVTEANPDAAFWSAPSPLRLETSSGNQNANLLLHMADAEILVNTHLRNTRSHMIWRVLFDYSALPYTQLEPALDHLRTTETSALSMFDEEEQLRGRFYENQAIEILQEFNTEARRLNAPFTLLLLQVGALVLLFLMVIAALVRREERREIAMLQSRGALNNQIVLVRGLEALVICIFATLAAPWLARQMLIVLTPALMDVDRLPLQVTSWVYVFAGLTAFAAWIALLMTLRPVLRLPLIAGGGSAIRSGDKLWWQTYYLDVVVMLLGLLGLWRLLNTDAVLIDSKSGQADPFLLITPALLFLAFGALLLRLFPEIMTLIARAFEMQRGLGGVLAGWQVSREPTHYARITFLLALAIGIGWFATSFQATVIRSRQDRAYYQTGADLRLVEQNPETQEHRLRPLSDYEALPGVEHLTALRRVQHVSVALVTLGVDTGEVLAVDHDSLSQTAYWRDDLDELRPPYDESLEMPQMGEHLPFRPEKIGFWAKLESTPIGGAEVSGFRSETLGLLTHLHVGVTLHDESGSSYRRDATLTEIPGTDPTIPAADYATAMFYNDALPDVLPEWVYYEVSLSEFQELPETDQLWFEGFYTYWFHFDGGFAQGRGLHLYVADLTLIDENGERVAVDWLTVGDWTSTPVQGIAEMPANIEMPMREITVDEAPDRAAGESLHFYFFQMPDYISNYQATLNYSEPPAIPALVNRSFLELNNLEVGLEFEMGVLQQKYTFRVLDVIDYYPTVYPETPTVIVDFAALRYGVMRQTNTRIQPNEIWLDLEPGVSSDEILQVLEAQPGETVIIESDAAEDVVEQLATDSLAIGLIGLMYLSFLIVLVLSMISLLTYLTLTARARKTEFGVLQALGVAPRRLVISLALEQVLVMGVAVIMGILIGTVLSTRILPTIASSTTTQTIAPPFLVQFEQEAIFQYGLLMAAVLVVVMTLNLIIVRRLSVSQVLQMGEE